MLPNPLQNAPAGAASPAALPVDHFFGPLHEAVPVGTELGGRDRAAVAGLGCVRGLRYAVAFEAAVALALYALWHFRHVFVH
jgi:hypothetical protein